DAVQLDPFVLQAERAVEGRRRAGDGEGNPAERRHSVSKRDVAAKVREHGPRILFRLFLRFAFCAFADGVDRALCRLAAEFASIDPEIDIHADLLDELCGAGWPEKFPP